MKQLLHKDFSLTAHPAMYMFFALTAMMLIPSYPYYVVFFYICLGIFFTFVNGREGRDIYYTALLPVRKRDVVRARCVMMVLTEAAYVLLSIPFACLNHAFISPVGNTAGMDINAALYGLVLGMLGIFNLVFLSEFYRDAYHAGRAFIFACIAITVYAAGLEISVHVVPWVKNTLDNFLPEYRGTRLCVLGGGILVYALCNYAAIRLAQARFERVEV